MDYLKMILTGYFENREYLTEYFIREQKKAEREFIDANEFFGKSKIVIQSFYENIDNRMGKRKNELYFMLDRAKNKASTFSGDFNPQLSYDELCQERIEYCQSELEKISRANYTVHISKSYFIGNLWNREIKYIEKVLKLAEKSLNEPDEEPQPKTEKKNKPGRKRVEVKEAKEYLQHFELPENKIKFLTALKMEYAKVKPQIFNHVIIALNEMGYLKPATKTEYRKAFEKALSREPQSKQNFDKQFEINPSTLKNTKFYEGIKRNIVEIIESKPLV